jgi:hypothetical protein
MNSFGDTLKSLDEVGLEKALGVFVAAVREAAPDAPTCYFNLLAAEGANRRKLQRQCEAHFNTMSIELRETIRGDAIARAQEIVQSPFERLAASMTASLKQTSLDDLFPK